MSSGARVLGIDIGTSSCKALALDHDGSVVGQVRIAYPPQTVSAFRAEQDPDDWYAAALRAIQTVCSLPHISSSAIASIAVTGQMNGLVCLDSAQRVLRPAIIWQDQRGVAEVRWLKAHHGPVIERIAGNPVTTSAALPQLLWVRNHEPGVWQQMSMALMPKDYVRLRFTGNPATDPSEASGTLLYDLREGCWSADLCDIAGLDGQSQLPPVIASAHLAGTLTAQAAHATGLTAGIPVATGATDVGAENLTLTPGEWLIRLGTSGVVSLVTTAAPLDRHHDYMCYAHPISQRYLMLVGTQYSGASREWFRRACASAGQADQLTHAQLDQLAQSAPVGSEGLFFHPFLLGEKAPYWDPHLRGSFVGLTEKHQAPHLARAVLEGVAYSLRSCIDLLTESGYHGARFSMTGGGARSQVWRQIVADVIGEDLRIAPCAEAVHGAALLAGVLIGLWPEQQLPVPSGPLVHHDGNAHSLYKKGHELYELVHQVLAPIYQGGFYRQSERDYGEVAE